MAKRFYLTALQKNPWMPNAGRMSLAGSISGLFKWRRFEPEVILLAVGWYLRARPAFAEGNIRPRTLNKTMIPL